MHGEIAHTADASSSGPIVVLSGESDEGRMRSEADELILAIARDQNRAAFAALFTQFAPRLKSYLMRSGAAQAQAEELAQEALIAVWRKAALFDPSRASAATWIFRIARNLRLDTVRRETSFAAYRPDVSDALDPPETPESAQLARQRDEQVRAALSQLSAEQVEVLRLSFFQDRPHSEIAEQLQLPLGTVKSRIRLALQKLRAALEGDR
jgi:RNA polymerase sigma-70 factor (ECF subfamily)